MSLVCVEPVIQCPCLIWSLKEDQLLHSAVLQLICADECWCRVCMQVPSVVAFFDCVVQQKDELLQGCAYDGIALLEHRPVCLAHRVQDEERSLRQNRAHGVGLKMCAI